MTTLMNWYQALQSLSQQRLEALWVAFLYIMIIIIAYNIVRAIASLLGIIDGPNSG